MGFRNPITALQVSLLPGGQVGVTPTPSSVQTFSLPAGAGTATANVGIASSTTAIVIQPKPTGAGSLSSNFFTIVGHNSGLYYAVSGACLCIGVTFVPFLGGVEPLIVAIPPGLDTSLDITGYQSGATPLNYELIQTQDVLPWVEMVRNYREVNLNTFGGFANAVVASFSLLQAGIAAGTAFCYRVHSVSIAGSVNAACRVVISDSTKAQALLALDLGEGGATAAAQSVSFPAPYYLGGPRGDLAALAVGSNAAVLCDAQCTADGYTFLT